MNFDKTNDKKVNNFILVIDRITDFALLFVLCVLTSHNSQVEGENYAYYIAFFFYIGIAAFRAIIKSYLNLSHFKVPTQTVWYGIYILLSVASLLWAKYPASTIEILSKLVQNLALSYFMIINVEEKSDYDRLMNIFLLSNIYMSVRMLLFNRSQSIFSSMLGNYDITGQNVNSTACYLSMCIIIVFYKFYIEKKRINVILLAFFTFVLILTSSRTSFAMVIISVFLMILFDKNAKNKALKLFIAFAVIAVIFVIVFTNENLYNAAGRKIESAFRFYGSVKSERSLVERTFFRKYALELFYKHPVIGVGLNNFGPYLNTVFTRLTYSHCNWLEQLSCLGIIGFVAYYWFYVFLAVKSVKLMKKGYNYLIFVFVSVIAMFITDYARVVYFESFIQLYISLCFVGVCVAQKDDKLLIKTYNGGNINGT